MLQSVLKEFLSYMEAGGWVMPPLVFLLLVLWFAIGYRFAALQRGTKRGVRVLIDRIERKKKYSDDGVIVRAVRKGIKLRKKGRVDLRSFLDDAFAEEEKEIRKFHVLITTIDHFPAFFIQLLSFCILHRCRNSSLHSEQSAA